MLSASFISLLGWTLARFSKNFLPSLFYKSWSYVNKLKMITESCIQCNYTTFYSQNKNFKPMSKLFFLSFVVADLVDITTFFVNPIMSYLRRQFSLFHVISRCHYFLMLSLRLYPISYTTQSSPPTLQPNHKCLHKFVIILFFVPKTSFFLIYLLLLLQVLIDCCYNSFIFL